MAALDRTQLTEALAEPEPYVRPVIRDAAQAWLDFPTDEMLEAAWRVLVLIGPPSKDQIQDALEAVRRVMFGDTDG